MTRKERDRRGEAHPYETGSVTSRDGTRIGYRQLGHGPGVVLLHGAASSSHNHMQLAEALADAFTLYLPDRRDRGLSGPFPGRCSLQSEVDDLVAVLSTTSAHNVFGVSSGAIVCLQAALDLAAIRRVAVYEPPFFMHDTVTPPTVLRRYEEEIAEGRVSAAVITGMKGAQMGPPIFNIMPRWLLEGLFKLLMHAEKKKGSGGYIPMRELAPTMDNDFRIIVETAGQVERFTDIRAEVLLLGGGKSPAYLKKDLDALEKALPNARRIEFPGLNHAASWNTARGGKPAPVAKELRRFFASSGTPQPSP